MSILPPRVAAIIRDTARAHGVSPGAILGRDRSRGPSAARHEAMRRVRALDSPKPSFPLIGRWFGRTHASVFQACRE